jgi:hypothetical protein
MQELQKVMVAFTLSPRNRVFSTSSARIADCWCIISSSPTTDHYHYNHYRPLPLQLQRSDVVHPIYKYSTTKNNHTIDHYNYNFKEVMLCILFTNIQQQINWAPVIPSEKTTL